MLSCVQGRSWKGEKKEKNWFAGVDQLLIKINMEEGVQTFRQSFVHFGAHLNSFQPVSYVSFVGGGDLLLPVC